MSDPKPSWKDKAQQGQEAFKASIQDFKIPKPKLQGRTWGLLIIVVLALGVILRGVALYRGSEAFKRDAMEKRRQYGVLEQEYQGIDQTPEKVNVEALKTQKYSAAKVGLRVSDLQTSYKTAGTDPVKNKEIKEALDGFMDGDNLPWITGMKEYTWTFRTLHESESSQIPCLFLAYQDVKRPETLVGIVRATFDGDQNRFVSKVVQMTDYGALNQEDLYVKNF